MKNSNATTLETHKNILNKTIIQLEKYTSKITLKNTHVVILTYLMLLILTSLAVIFTTSYVTKQEVITAHKLHISGLLLENERALTTLKNTKKDMVLHLTLRKNDQGKLIHNMIQTKRSSLLNILKNNKMLLSVLQKEIEEIKNLNQ